MNNIKYMIILIYEPRNQVPFQALSLKVQRSKASVFAGVDKEWLY